MSAAVAAAAAAAALSQRRYGSDSSWHGSADSTVSLFDYNINANPMEFFPQMMQPLVPSRYESQKRRDWASFSQYLRDHRPLLPLSRCSGAHVIEFLKYLDQFGKTKVHTEACPFFGMPCPPAACPCPLRQAWASLDALVGRLRAAFEEKGGCPEANPFGARAVRLYLREVSNAQAKARGIAYEKKKRRNPTEKVTQQNYEDAEEHNDHPARTHPTPI